MSLKSLFAAGAASLLCACSLFESDGRVTLSVTDAPVDGVEQVVVQFSRVTFVDDDDQRERINLSPALQIDLRALNGGDSVELVSAKSLPEGRYGRIEFRIDGSPTTTESFVVEAGGTERVPLYVPDDASVKLAVATDFKVDTDSSVALTVDFDLRRSLFKNDDGTYALRPQLRVVIDDQAGKVSGSIAAGLLDDCGSAAIYAFRGSDITPDDVDGLGVEPVNSTIVSVADDGSGSYAVAFLEAGSYTLALTCEADLDEPDQDDAIDFVRERNVTIRADRTTVQNFN